MRGHIALDAGRERHAYLNTPLSTGQMRAVCRDSLSVGQYTENGYGILKLPNPEAAVISQEKLQHYLLSETHPIGRFKDKLFRELGYSSSHWSQLQTDLKGFLAFDAIEKEKTPYGQKYEIGGELMGPNGKSINLVTAWIVLKTEAFPRFITAYPGE